MYRGELVWQFVLDMGGEVRPAEAKRLLQGMATARAIEPSKSTPPYVDLARPISLAYPPREIATDAGAFTATLEAHIHTIGAIAVSIRVAFEANDLAQVDALTHMRPKVEGSFGKIARDVAADITTRVRESLVETYEARVEPEQYLVIVLTQTPAPASDLLEREATALAGLLAGERRAARLSSEEVRDNLRTWFSYYEDDLIVVDWDRSLVIEPTGKYDDVLSVIEAANLELLELRAYDRYLDTVLEEAYEDLSRFYRRGGVFRSARGVQEELSNIRIDLVRVTDTINNIGKIFGDYYLAKLHLGLAERFHLKEWEEIVREKMATLNELYTLASHEVEHRRGMALEGMIVLLFIVDLIVIYLVGT